MSSIQLPGVLQWLQPRVMQHMRLFTSRHAILRCTLAALFGGLFVNSSAHALISGINTPGTSFAVIHFDDTNSIAPPAGSFYTTPTITPWNGSILTLASTTDPTTFDTGSASVVGSFTPSSNIYAINFPTVSLSQTVGNTGLATIDVYFNIEYQLDAAGLPLQPTLFPNFVVNGTVQSSSGSFAAIKGYINYSGVNTAGTISLLDTVVYNSVWTTPGPFSAVAVGVPSFGTTPALVGGTTLTLDGQITFTVDPASFDAYTVQSVPEPASLVLFGLACGVAALRRRRILPQAPGSAGELC